MKPLFVIVVSAILCVAAVAFAQDVPTVDSVTGEQVPGLIQTVFTAIKNKDWTLLTSAVIMLAVFAGNFIGLSRLNAKQRKRWMPWVAVAAAFLVQYAATLATSGSFLEAANSAFITGASAGGLWSLLGKTVLSRFAPPPAADKTD